MAKKKLTRPRLLTRHELETLKFLWRWKLANTLTLKTVVAPKRNIWKYYQLLRRLVIEGYIHDIADSHLQLSLFTLTKKGFQVISGGLNEQNQKRFQPQSVAHDYWATAFHLGEFVHGMPDNVELFSEQEINASETDCFPDWLPKSKVHIPDGYTLIKKPGIEVLAIEVELSQKTMARYEEMIGFLDRQDEISRALWLCASERLIEKISQKIVSQKRIRPNMHNFVLLENFQKHGWQCPILWGDKTDATVRSVMGQDLRQTPGNMLLTSQKHLTHEVFLSNAKSPRGLRA